MKALQWAFVPVCSLFLGYVASVGFRMPVLMWCVGPLEPWAPYLIGIAESLGVFAGIVAGAGFSAPVAHRELAIRAACSILGAWCIFQLAVAVDAKLWPRVLTAGLILLFCAIRLIPEKRQQED